MLLSNRFYNLFDEMFNDSFFGEFTKDELPQMMRTDIREKDGQYLVDIELPGYEKKDVQAELKDGYLTIMASKEDTIEEEDKKTQFIRKERYSGKCKRSFYVGKNIKEEDIQAAFKDGILQIMIVKEKMLELPDEQRRLIEIN